MSVEQKSSPKNILDRTSIKGAEIYKDGLGGIIRKVRVKNGRTAFLLLKAPLSRGAFKDLQVDMQVIEPEDPSVSAKRISREAWDRMQRARKGDFS